MAQRQPHVPKFSDFEGGDDFSYAAYLEKPSQAKGTGVRINRNGPKKSPPQLTNEKTTKKGNESGNDSFPPISVSVSSIKSTPVEKRQNNHRKTNSRSIYSEPSSDKSNTDNFVNRKDNRKKSVVKSDYYVPPSLGHGSISNLSDMSYGSVSVPKFGTWDDKDPTSGDGFTMIFNKVKEEKQIAASKFPVMPPQVVTHTTAQKEKKNNKVKSSKGPKKWCCLFSSG